jgi:hypothetical protein
MANGVRDNNREIYLLWSATAVRGNSTVHRVTTNARKKQDIFF